MGMSKAKQQRNESENPSGSGRNLFRIVAASSMGVLLLSSAFSASWGGGFGRGYGGDDDDEGLSGAETAGIVIGTLGVGYFVMAAADDDDDEDTTTTARPTVKPSGSGAVGAARLVPVTPSGRTIEAGATSVFDLQIRSKTDGKWHSVTDRKEASIGLAGSNAGLVKMDGTKNAFALPVTAQTRGSRSVVVTGTYTPAGGSPVTASTTVNVGS